MRQGVTQKSYSLITLALWLKADDGEKKILLFIVLGNLSGAEHKSAVAWLEQSMESS